MAVFLFCAFPLLLTIAVSASQNMFRLRAGVTGLFAGIIVCAARALFVFPSRDIPAAFFPAFWRLYFETAAATLILFTVFFLLCKGNAREKSRAFIFVIFAYCAVPLLYAAAAAGSAAAASCFCAALSKSSNAPYAVRALVMVISAAFFLLCIAFPCAAETSRVSGGSAYMMITPLCIAFSAVFLVMLLCLRKGIEK
jgi:hypothetical protein